MCVIFLANDTRPTEEMVSRAFTSNSHGGGVAWRDVNEKDGKPEVRWAKGLNEEEMQERIATMPLPFVAHFRIASCGGQSAQLCHPFPIDAKAPLFLEGKTKGYVLFHNGHYVKWRDEVKETALKKGAPIPTGKWSDSRGMAWLAYHYGLGILEMIDEKVIAFGPTDLEIFSTGWSKPTGIETSLYASNKHWEHSTGDWRRTNRGNSDGMDGFEWCGAGADNTCQWHNCNKFRYGTTNYCFEHQLHGPRGRDSTKGGGAVEQDPFRKPGGSAEGREAQQEAVQEGQEAPGTAGAEGEDRSGFSDHSLGMADEMLRWAKSLNPKSRRQGISSATVITDLRSAQDDTLERAKRIIDSHNGVQRAIVAQEGEINMLRIYREFGIKVLLILTYLRRAGADTSFRTIERWLEAHPKKGEEAGDAALFSYLEQIGGPYGGTYTSLDDMRAELQKQIEQFNKGAAESDLIDSIVQILGLPYTRNLLSHRSLSNLRQALLVPEEMAKYNTGARQRELACTECGNPFKNREMATAIQSQHGMDFLCINCAQPEWIACNTCKGSWALLGSRFTKRLRKGFACEKHKKEGSEGEGERLEGAALGGVAAAPPQDDPGLPGTPVFAEFPPDFVAPFDAEAMQQAAARGNEYQRMVAEERARILHTMGRPQAGQPAPARAVPANPFPSPFRRRNG